MKSLCKQTTGSALRGGAADEMVYNITCPIILVISRGGWDWKGK